MSTVIGLEIKAGKKVEAPKVTPEKVETAKAEPKKAATKKK